VGLFPRPEFLADFIVEWGPPSADFYVGFVIYIVLFVAAITGTAWVSWRRREWVQHLWTVPFFIIGFMGFTASRNIYIGFYASLFLLGVIVPQLIADTPLRIKKLLWGTLLVFCLCAPLWLFTLKYTTIRTQRLHYPVGAAEFAKRYLSGRMFNEYTTGGYMLYAVYPKLQIFLDGRAEVFRRFEMRDYIELSGKKLLPDSEYKAFLDTFFNKYAFDFIIISVQKHIVMRRVGTLLMKDPNWALVYWDDDSEVFVRKNGKNDAIVKQLEAKAATPYLRDPFDREYADQALSEYERMDAIIQSARTSNALGYLSVLRGDFTTAKNRFTDAVNRDPTFESPYMNLAELSVRDGNIPTAIRLYQKAHSLAPDRGLPYIRLGQLMLEVSPADKEAVRTIWREGVKSTVDTDTREQLAALLLTL
jgi:tetratricopeptide (TPR) repeat protein